MPIRYCAIAGCNLQYTDGIPKLCWPRFEMLSLIEKLVEKLATRTTFASFILGLLVAVITASIVGLAFHEIDDIWTLKFSQNSGFTTIIAFVASFLITTLMAFILFIKEGEDYFTPIRKSLKGTWAVYYTDWQIDNSGRINPKKENDTATIGISLSTRKLFIASSLHNHEVFNDYERNIEDISLNVKSNPIKLTYSHRLSAQTRSGKIVEGNIFVMLDVFLDDSTNNPTKMTGTWYDLDQEFNRAKAEYYKEIHPNCNFEQIPASGSIEYIRLTK